MNMKTFLLPLMLALPVSSMADIVMEGNMPTVVEINQAPSKGMSKVLVKKQFGNPTRTYKSPGKVTKKNPRITVWTYPMFKVFFENNHVIHTVVKQAD